MAQELLPAAQLQRARHLEARFASLWGGSTLPELRNRGLYTSLLAARILVGQDEAPDAVNAVMAASPLPSEGLPGPRVMGFLGCGAVVGLLA